jgi:hypothetical protein
VADHSERGDHDELVIEVAPGWRSREGRVRILHRSVTDRDVEELAELAAQTALSEVILIEVASEPGAVTAQSTAVQVVAVDDLIARFEDSAMITWDGPRPKADREALRGLRAVDAGPATVDVLGLRALPILARNKLPVALARAGSPPDELFERMTFRVLTHVFRFGGRDLGASARAQRLPDALLEAPAGARPGFSAVLDCKASRDGFQMDADDETRLCGYVDAKREELQSPEAPFVIVVSSAFPGRSDRFPRRRTAIADRSGGQLVYLRVEHLVAAAVKVETAAMDPEARETLPWHDYLALGRPTLDLVAFAEREIG